MRDTILLFSIIGLVLFFKSLVFSSNIILDLILANMFIFFAVMGIRDLIEMEATRWK